MICYLERKSNQQKWHEQPAAKHKLKNLFLEPLFKQMIYKTSKVKFQQKVSKQLSSSDFRQKQTLAKLPKLSQQSELEHAPATEHKATIKKSSARHLSTKQPQIKKVSATLKMATEPKLPIPRKLVTYNKLKQNEYQGWTVNNSYRTIFDDF